VIFCSSAGENDLQHAIARASPGVTEQSLLSCSQLNLFSTEQMTNIKPTDAPSRPIGIATADILFTTKGLA